MKDEDINKIKVSHLSEALPYIQKYAGEIFVIKYGGSALTNPEIEESTINDLVLLSSVGIKVILVHGGGPEINKMLEKLGKEIKFEKGLRKTDSETMEIVEMVLHGKVQRRLVTAINCAGARAIGISGRDGRIMLAQAHSEASDGNMVGEIKAANLELIYSIMSLGLIPVISSIAPDEKGNAYNINADTMCAELASGLKARKMLLMTDTPGILKNKNDKKSLITNINIKDAQKLIEDGIVTDGMIPKTQCCIKALESGVKEAVILNGLEKHCLLLEALTDHGAGTLIRP
jgi:acetylglutamate kinase